MKQLYYNVCLFMLCILQVAYAPPVTQKKEVDEKENEIKDDLDEYMEYHRYLKEIVQTLESDPDFRDKLEKAEEIDIRSGKIAHELEKVSHNVRSKLDELKRQELERLRHLATKEFELTNDLDSAIVRLNNQAQHLDHSNLHTFEVEDLKRLIKKTTADLAEADRKRREEFKQYEMQKEFEKQQKLQSLDEDHKKQFEKELKDQETKHKKHDKLHHPGTKQQLEEVWETQDHMENQEFDPKIFFMLHDVDGNGYWDENEVKALFRKELDKMYKQGMPGSDMKERQEEMERMREHVFEEADENRDSLISYDEFLVQTRRAEFAKDPGWKGLDEQQVYTQEEYHEYEKKRLEEVQKLIDQGLLPPHPQFYGGPPGSQQNFQQPGHPQQGYQHPPQYFNQIPPAYQQAPQYQQQNPQYQAHQQGQMQYQNAPGQPQYQQQAMQYQQAQQNQPHVPMHQNQIPMQSQTINQGQALNQIPTKNHIQGSPVQQPIPVPQNQPLPVQQNAVPASKQAAATFNQPQMNIAENVPVANVPK